MITCPKCQEKLYAVTKIVLGGKNKHFQECEKCGYKTEAK